MIDLIHRCIHFMHTPSMMCSAWIYPYPDKYILMTNICRVFISAGYIVNIRTYLERELTDISAKYIPISRYLPDNPEICVVLYQIKFYGKHIKKDNYLRYFFIFLLIFESAGKKIVCHDAKISGLSSGCG